MLDSLPSAKTIVFSKARGKICQIFEKHNIKFENMLILAQKKLFGFDFKLPKLPTQKVQPLQSLSPSH